MTSTKGTIPKYQVLLNQEIQDRKRLNPRYSGRAMARDLGLSSAFLSQLMSGKRTLSDDKASAIAKRLNWTERKRHAFLLLAQIDRAKSPELKQTLAQEYRKTNVPVRKRRGFLRMNLDTFSLISEWYHFAIVEAADVKSYKPNLEWIAGRFGISTERAKEALERLVRVGLLSKDLRKLESNYRIGDIPSEAIRAFHRQMLKLASIALERQPPDQRDFSGCTIAFDPKKMPAVRELIRNFQKELMEVAAEGDKTAVYQMSMQLFRLDKDT